MFIAGVMTLHVLFSLALLGAVRPPFETKDSDALHVVFFKRSCTPVKACVGPY